MKSKGKIPREALSRRAKAPQTFSAWKAKAVALMGGRAGTMPESQWKRLYIRGADVTKAAREAQVYRENMSAARRSR